MIFASLRAEEVSRDAPREDEGEDGPGEGGAAREARAGDAERKERERDGERGVEAQRVGEAAVERGVEGADGGGLYLNNERVGAADLVSEDRVIDGQVLVLRAGKKNQRVVKLAR